LQKIGVAAWVQVLSHLNPPIGLGGGLLIALTVISSALGYLGGAARILSFIVAAIYRRDYRGSIFLKITDPLERFGYLSFFLGMATIPVAVILGAVAIFLPVGKQAKVVIWIIILGAVVGWIIAAEPFSHPW
jgi:hypothetical protein